jgi:hypothetical protein
MVLHRRLHDRKQRRLVGDPVRIVTIALNGRINDSPPGGQLGETAETMFDLIAWDFDLGVD